MRKISYVNVLFSIINLVFLLLILIAYATQFAGIQLIAIQRIYWSLDTLLIFPRILFLSFFLVAGAAILFLYRTKPILGKSFKFGILAIIIGLILGLSIFCGYSCCDTPVTFLLGFPLSWLRGISEAQNRLSSSIPQYLFLNIFTINWYVDIVCLFIDILFWYNIGIICFCILKGKKITLLSSKQDIL